LNQTSLCNQASNALAHFARTYPKIILELISSNDSVDLVTGEYGAGVQLGEFIQRDIIAVPVTGEMRLAVVGSTTYFESNAIPRNPKNLKDHSAPGSAMVYIGGV
jgi:DNA-binding transcriptional LysR family regulator